MTKCKICGEEKTNNKGLSYHVWMKHKIKFVDYVLKFEHNDVRPLCECGCGSEVKFLGGKFMQFKNGHFNIGKPKSEETRKKISDAQKGKTYTDERKQRISSSMKKRYAEGHVGAVTQIEKMADAVRGTTWTEEHREKMSTTRSAKFASGELKINREKISETISNMYLSGGFKWAKGHYTSSKTGKSSYYRSSWELKHMQSLDADVMVSTWQYEPFKLQYTWEGKTHNYLPDFLVTFADGRKELQEVGVKSVKIRPRQSAKSAAGEAWAKDQHNTVFKVVSF